VQAKGLIDTGAVVALLDRDDDWHDACTKAFEHVHLPLLTSSAVLAEAFHLFAETRHETRTLWGFLRSGAVTLGALSDRDSPALEKLMDKYHDRPMDFADATLVHLAERESLNTIFTIDHDDFETYRIASRRRFRILPRR
jgi:hypothetical protein